jgi:hypothetical protein
MKACTHGKLDAEVKASAARGCFTVRFRAWCAECFSDFRLTEDMSLSLDQSEMVIRIEPANGIASRQCSTTMH